MNSGFVADKLCYYVVLLKFKALNFLVIQSSFILNGEL